MKCLLTVGVPLLKEIKNVTGASSPKRLFIMTNFPSFPPFPYHPFPVGNGASKGEGEELMDSRMNK